MPEAAFFDYVRGRSDVVPAGYREAGMRAYRHLTWLGASQTIDAAWPTLRPTLGEADWHTLIAAFVRDSQWESHHLADLTEDFERFLARQRAA